MSVLLKQTFIYRDSFIYCASKKNSFCYFFFAESWTQNIKKWKVRNFVAIIGLNDSFKRMEKFTVWNIDISEKLTKSSDSIWMYTIFIELSKNHECWVFNSIANKAPLFHPNSKLVVDASGCESNFIIRSQLFEKLSTFVRKTWTEFLHKQRLR